MSYESQTAAISHQPVTLVEIDLDFCQNDYGVSPCTASGSAGNQCYNCFFTCHDKSNFSKGSKTYAFQTLGTAQVDDFARPYIKAVDFFPTEIKDAISTRARIKITLHDEEDTDVGIDPYVADRSSVQGTYFKKLLARNPNYKGRSIVVKDGYAGLDTADFVERWAGSLENIEINDGLVTIEAVDLIADLKEVKTPIETDCELVSDLSDSSTDIVLTTVEGFDSSGYVLIDDEVIAYASITTAQNKLTGCTRGAFGTTADIHDAETAVQPCRYFAPDNPYDHLTTLFTEGGLASRLDTTAIAYWKSWPHEDLDFSALITSPTTLYDLVWEIAGLLDIKLWQNEEQLITVRRNMANEPSRTAVVLSDAANFSGKMKVDQNEKSRKTRVILYWDKTVLGDPREPKDYQAKEIAIDAESEGVNMYNGEIEHLVFCRWVRPGYAPDAQVRDYLADMAGRLVLQRRDAAPLLSVVMARKDEGVLTGDIVQVETDEVTDIHGNPITDFMAMVTRREIRGNQINYTLMRLPRAKICFIAPDAHPDFDAASEAEKQYGFICRDDGMMDDTTEGYRIW